MRKESELLSQNNSNLKKVILIDEETLKALMEGKRVEGAIRKTQDGLVFRGVARISQTPSSIKQDADTSRRVSNATRCG